MRLFWRLTPREFQALATRRHVQTMMDDIRAGQIAALLAESMRDRKKHPTPFSPADFFPSLAQAAARAGASPKGFDRHGRVDPEALWADPDLARRNSERMLAQVVAINKDLGGRDLRRLPPPAE